ncbi:dihydrodipicolinate synthase family protein [Mesorhizobium sp. L-8-10]|uniref:dihydrodipicolinate synthase family protein n=1 Tax=Mesorhizobium sp. L-8-10 TaxID=2744523 RepID=UPI0019270ADE|nr:dihydrodipicolinate synthase family protein [Mesorhizobium sp. L-8-10]BCH29500.1 dihydrodipicolinate synthase family protein [Mesorhizobium sp. L-8-10]
MTMLKGVIAAAATPLTDNLSIDLDGLVSHCAHLLEAGGCDGINLLGTTGEATSFSVEQRVAAMRAVASSGLPLSRFMVGTGAAAFEDACRLTAEAKVLGFAGALLLPPFYYKGIGADALVDYVTAVVDRVGRDGLPLYLYHFPGNSGVPYTHDAVIRLRDRLPDALKGLKDSTGDLDYSGGLARALPGFDVFPSAEAAIGRAAELGLAGCISATANVTGPFAQAAFTGKTQAEREAGLAEAVRIRAEIAKFPLVAAVKETLALISGNAKWRRMMPPLTALSEAEREALVKGLASTALLGSGAAALSKAG